MEQRAEQALAQALAKSRISLAVRGCLLAITTKPAAAAGTHTMLAAEREGRRQKRQLESESRCWGKAQAHQHQMVCPESCARRQAYTAVWSAEREGARHERQLDAESSARSELASTLAQSEHVAQEMGSLLTQQRTVRHSHPTRPSCST